MPHTKRPRLLWALGFNSLLATAALSAPPTKKTPTVDYVRDVRPILSEKCFACHGADEKQRQAGLRLDVRESALAKSPSGSFAIVPGKPAKSSLVERIHATTPLQMPPPQTGKKLTPDEKKILRVWVAAGAKYAPHWGFIKPRRTALPNVKNGNLARNPIDRFVLARLEKEGLTLSPPADRHTLLRRVSLDLTGLPPTPQETQNFLADRSPNAYETAVERLLTSPRYGEKWARMWLDLARYADSAGYGSDPLRPNLFPFRDWVIDAFNRNLPYDQFTKEQLAGDLIPNATDPQRVATAFHRNTMTNTEGGTDDEEFRTAAVKDRTIVTMQVWMGLTFGCAQCHSHKYDPITQNEFYQTLAFFNQTEDFDQPDERPTMDYWTAEQRTQRERLQREIAEMQQRGAKPEETKAKTQELAALKPVPLPILREVAPDKQRKTRKLTLGNFLLPTEEVSAAMPVAFPKMSPELPQNRMGVAMWLVSKENPLTARVAVNRFWAQIFGAGIVQTEEDFGQQGAYPSHPELLDWLALEFQEKGWNIKALLKTIVLSATYRQSSRVLPEQLAKDPRNHLLARFPRRRLDAEMVRDQALSLSGLLSTKIGGPSVFPPQPEGLWQAAFNGERTWTNSKGEDRYRRGLYTFWRRTTPYPSMATFDAPSREVCTIRRFPTNTPLQALVTLNDPAYLEMAQALGRRIVREGGYSLESRLKFALSLAQAKPAQEAQVQTLKALFTQELAYHRAHAEDAKRLATEPLGPAPEGMDTAELATWTVVANVLLNLDGVLTKN